MTVCGFCVIRGFKRLERAPSRLAAFRLERLRTRLILWRDCGNQLPAILSIYGKSALSNVTTTQSRVASAMATRQASARSIGRSEYFFLASPRVPVCAQIKIQNQRALGQ